MEFTLNGQRHQLTKKDVETTMRRLTPDRIFEHAVEVNGVMFPVKQVFAAAVGVDVSQFTSQRAQDVLRRLGFVDPRRSTGKPALKADADRPVWVLHLRTSAGGHQRCELPGKPDGTLLKAVGERPGSATTDTIDVVQRDALGGTARITIGWNNVVAASLYRTTERAFADE